MTGLGMQHTLVLIVPGRPMSANDRQHWSAKARATARVRKEVCELAYEQWGHAATARRSITGWPVTITVVDHCRTANLRDTANSHPHVKAIIDGISKTYGLMLDDGPLWVGSIRFMPAVKTGVDELVLTFVSSTS